MPDARQGISTGASCLILCLCVQNATSTSLKSYLAEEIYTTKPFVPTAEGSEIYLLMIEITLKVCVSEPGLQFSLMEGKKDRESQGTNDSKGFFSDP